MRYESFYPFARNQSPVPRQQNFGFNPYSGPPQNPRQPQPFGMPNNQFPGPRQGQLGFGQQIAGQATPGQSQGVADGLSKMDGYMQTANRFLNTAQQFAPVVQQFAPMMRNLPAMWKLYKGFQSIPSAGAAATSATAGLSNPGVQTSAPLPSFSSSNPIASSPSASYPRPSVPRIFQPTDL